MKGALRAGRAGAGSQMLAKRWLSSSREHGRVGWRLKPEDFFEQFAYDYLQQTRAMGATPGLQALMEALVFVRFIFNVQILDQALSSRRCKGVGSGKKATVERDEPLTIRDLQHLHALLENVGEPLWERMLAGSALCCLYARSCCVNARYFSGDPLFLAAISPRVTASNWAQVWMDVQAELGLVSMVPPCPAPRGNGQATKRPVDTDEVSLWLRTILGR